MFFIKKYDKKIKKFMFLLNFTYSYDRMQLQISCKEVERLSQFEKLWEWFLLVPSDFTYEELRKIMKHYGYSENNKGKTSGSRVGFIKRDDVEKTTIFLHKPHGSNAYVRKAAIRSIIAAMERNGDIK